MKSGLRIWLISVVTMTLLTACISPPSKELAAARDAVDEVVSDGAELFIPDEVLNLNQKLEWAINEMRNQDGMFFKNYALAKVVLVQVVADADQLKSILASRKAELKIAADKALQEAWTLIAEIRVLLTVAPQEPCSPIDNKAMQSDIDDLEARLRVVQPQIDASEFTAATDNAKEVATRARALRNGIKQNQAKLAALR